MNEINNYANAQEDYTNYLNNLMDYIGIALIVIAAILLVVLVFFIISAIRRWKVQKALLNIDKNVEKLTNTSGFVTGEQTKKDNGEPSPRA